MDSGDSGKRRFSEEIADIVHALNFRDRIRCIEKHGGKGVVIRERRIEGVRKREI